MTPRSLSGQQSAVTAWQAHREDAAAAGDCAAITSSVMMSIRRWRS